MSEFNSKVYIGTDLKGRIETDRGMTGRIQSGSSLVLYKGPYDVVPSTEVQVLRTRMQSMKRDITVWAIPYSETSNDKGGYTVTIG